MANTITNETADLFATIGSLIGRGRRIATATVGSTIDCLGRTDDGDSSPRIENQEAVNYKVHCGDEALAREAGV
ncbi:hypothetical protein HHL24_08965 [Paraburkholderia sp. RP-4-7]|uniref:Uncharacterized protein n=1 Tax=Paraburkholderia polaris TaxID=2728848 RepID=A0A848I9J5_9BURK|nr:hypothetical protein [Paraburkholderia polaris]NML98079.1 hypothetical protein [Paraburkholderia polaris]